MNEDRRKLIVIGLCTHHHHHCAKVASLQKPLYLLLPEPQEDPSYVWAHWQPKELPLAQELPPLRARCLIPAGVSPLALPASGPHSGWGIPACQLL